VLFDTRDAVESPPGPGGATRGPGMQALRAILSALDIPSSSRYARPCAHQDVLSAQGVSRPLQHRAALGRGAAGRERRRAGGRPARAGDGVSSIIITSNDFAGAWAMRQDGQAMLPLVSAEPRQREFAFRAASTS